MAIIKSFSPKQNLSNYGVFLTDTQSASQYFRVSEFQDVFTGGKNAFLIEGSEFLKKGTEVKIEILDVEGNPIYYEPGDGVPEYYEGTSKLISVHVYEDTPIGVGKITILGELDTFIDNNGTEQQIPADWQGIYNVKWERTFQVNKNLNNETRVRFYKRPLVTISELTKPIFSKSVPSVTKTGYVHGIAQIPPSGTDIRDWRAGTNYKLQLTSGSWDRDVDENTITITTPSFSGKIIEVLNDTEVLVDVPYTINNLVSNFTSGSYSISYSDFQNEVVGESTLTGSFAKIDITQLKTFVGDVARVKVFRKSRNTAGDFQLVDESKLESTELLKDITTQTNTELSYGRFDETTLANNWISSSNDHPLSIDSSILSQAVKIDYDSSVGGVQQLITSQSFNISQDVEYTLKFKTLLSGSINTTNVSNTGNTYSLSTSGHSEGIPQTTYQVNLPGQDWVTYVGFDNVGYSQYYTGSGCLTTGDKYKITFTDGTSSFDGVWQFNGHQSNNADGSFTSPRPSSTYSCGDDANALTNDDDQYWQFSFTDADGRDRTSEMEPTYKEILSGSPPAYTNNPNWNGNEWRIIVGDLSENSYTYEGTTTTTSQEKSIRAFFSSSNFTQDFTTISGSAIYKTRQDESHNLISQNSGNAKLVFEVKGDDWYISNASLKNAQDTSFSPDEITVIQDIPRKTASETFDFRFEFYDINNNYIPVDVTAVGTFDGGNDFPSSGKLLSFESDRNAFRFSSGSIANPTNQTIKFSITQNGLTGSTTFASSAFDIDGNYLPPSEYTQYPGKLTNVTTAGALVTLANFTGSRVDGLSTPFVGSVVYTASLEGLEEFETVYRLEDGDNAPQLVATTNTSQFIYEPTTLSPKLGQVITIRAQRKNLASLITPIEVNSGSNLPELTFVETVGGIDTYTITATQFSQSFAQTDFDSVTYSFTGSDVFGNSQSDEVTISKVINFDAVSLVLSNESTSFPAKSNGEVTGGFVASSGSVQMFVGGTEIQHNEGLGTRNRFDITSISGTNVTPTTTSPNTKNYSISAFENNKDSGSLTLNIEYLAGDNVTSQSFQKIVSYTKAKKAVPNALTKTSPSTQTINSSSLGFGVPQDVEVVVQEGGTEYSYQSGLTGGDSQAYKFEIISISSGSQHPTLDNLIVPDYGYGSNYNGTIGSASISYVNSEGDLIENKLVRFDVNVSKVGVDGQSARGVKLTFSDNSITYDSTGSNPQPSTVTLIASASNFDAPRFKFTGGGSYFTDETSFTAGENTNSDTASVTVPSSYQTTPLSFEVEVEEASNSLIRASDRETLSFVKPGLDITPRFIIKPINGTQLKNTRGALELQVVKIDGSGSVDISGSAQGDAQIYSGSNILSTVTMDGIANGGNGVTYNPLINAGAISGSKLLSLQDSSGNILDTITLLDVTDGTPGGSFLTSTGLLTRRVVGNTYEPTSLDVTASFYDVEGNEYKKSVTITPNWNGTIDQMKVSTASGYSDITLTANDGDGNSLTLGDTNYTNTKDVVLVATFQDSLTPATNPITITETFFIVSDGRDGTSARTIRLGADSQIFTVDNSGSISPSTITLTANTQNVSGSLTFNATNGVTLTGSGNTRTIGNGEFSNDAITQTVVSVTGSEAGSTFTDEITIVKLNAGTDAITIFNTNQSHTLPASSSGVVLDYNGSGTTIKVFEGTTELSYNNDGTLGSDWDISTSVTPSGVITVGSLTDNGDNVTFGNHSSMHDDSGSAVITYSVVGSRRDGREFEAETTQTITKAKEGLDSLTLTNTNTNHTFVANSSGLVSSYSDGGTDIQVIEGGTELTFTTGTPSNGEFTVSIGNTSGITEGTASGNGTTTLTISNPSAMTVSSAVVTYTITGKRIGGDSFTLTTTQTFSKAQAGSTGVDAQLVKLSSNKYAIKYDGDGNLAPSGQTFTLSGSAQGFSTPEFRFLENGSQIQGFSTDDNFTIPTDGGALPSVGTANLYQVQVREQGGSYESVFDNIDVFAVQSGSDSYTTFLTNEAHVFSANSVGDLLSPLADGAFETRFFRGATQYTYDQTSPYSDNSYRTGSVTLNNITTGSSVVSNQLKITPASLTDDSGSIIIDLIDNATDTTFENTYTFAKSKSGANAVNISISPQAQTIASASGVYGTPQDVFITVTEGGELYTYDSVSPYGDSTFRITGVDGGTDSSTEGATSGSITPPAVTTDDGYSKTITLAYKNSEGTSFTNKTIDYNVGVAKQGEDGAAGQDAKSIKLTASQYSVLYDGDGNKTAVAIVLTGTAQNFSSPQYRFLENGTERQTWSTTNTYTIPDGQEAAANSADVWKVEVREGSSGTYDAFDSINIFGIQDGADGSDAYTVILTNESHTLPTTNSGTVTYTGSGTQIIVYKGTTELDGVTSGTPGSGEFKVTASGTNITPNASPTSTGNPVVYGVHSAMTQNTATITYTINVENQTSFTKIQSFAKSIEGADGPTGPQGAGVVFRGEYSSSETYFHTDQRRDVVKYSSNYYLTDNTAKNGLTTWGTPTGTDWESFGAQFSSVATDILLAQDVYADRTVNIGASGGTPVIALNADSGNSNANPFISIGQSSAGFGNSGIFLGYDGGTGKLSVTNGLIGGWSITEDSLTNAGTGIGLVGGDQVNLDVYSQGDVDANGDFYLYGIRIDKNNYWGFYSTDSFDTPGQTSEASFRAGDDDAYFYFNETAGRIGIKSPNLEILATNSSSQISATNGDIGGWDINSNFLENNGVLLVATAASNPNTSNTVNPGLAIDDGNKERIIITATDSFQTSAAAGAASSQIIGDTSSTDSVSGAIYNNNTLAEAIANGQTYSVTKTYNMTVGQKIGVTEANLTAFTSQTPGTSWLTRANTSDFFLSYHFIVFKVQFKSGTNGGGSTLLTQEATVVQGSVHHYSSQYHKNLTSSVASFIAPNNTQSVVVTVSHHIGMDYLSTGLTITLRASIPSFTPSLGNAPQTVEVCRQGIQVFAADNFFKIDTDGGSSTFLDIAGSTAIDGNLNATSIEAESATITSLQITDLSFAGSQLTINGDLRVTGDIYAQATSDRRLKNNLSIIDNPLSKIIKLNGYEFDWLESEVHGLRGHDIGVIAQEVEEIIPSAVGLKRGEYKGVEYHKIIPLLIEGIKEQQVQIEDLKEEIKKLKEE